MITLIKGASTNSVALIPFDFPGGCKGPLSHTPQWDKLEVRFVKLRLGMGIKVGSCSA
jgi:hypothetical protein